MSTNDMIIQQLLQALTPEQRIKFGIPAVATVVQQPIIPAVEVAEEPKKKRGRPSKTEEEKRATKNAYQQKSRSNDKMQGMISAVLAEPEELRTNPWRKLDGQTIDLIEVYDAPMLSFIVNNWDELVKKELIGRAFDPKTNSYIPDAVYKQLFLSQVNVGVDITNFPCATRRVSYHQCYYGFGRQIARSMSLQGMSRILRQLLCRKYCVDIDIKSAHPNFYLDLCKRADLNSWHTADWFQNRDRYVQEVIDKNEGFIELDADAVKQQILSFLNGGNLKKYKLGDEDVTIKFTDKMAQIFGEVRDNAPKLVEYLDTQVSTKYSKAIKSKSDWRSNTNFRILNMYYCDMENQALHVIHTAAYKSGFDVAALVFDGCMIVPEKSQMQEYSEYVAARDVNDKAERPAWLSKFLRLCERDLAAELEMALTVVDKVMDEPENKDFCTTFRKKLRKLDSMDVEDMRDLNVVSWKDFDSINIGDEILTAKLAMINKNKLINMGKKPSKWLTFDDGTKLFKIWSNSEVMTTITSNMSPFVFDALRHYRQECKILARQIEEEESEDKAADLFKQLTVMRQRKGIWDTRGNGNLKSVAWINYAHWGSLVEPLGNKCHLQTDYVDVDQCLNKRRHKDDPMRLLIPVGDGLCFDLATDQLIPRTEEHLFTCAMDFTYVPYDEIIAEDKAPWENYIMNLCTPKKFCSYDDDGNLVRNVPPAEQENVETLAKFLQKCAGYSITGDSSSEVCFMLQGQGANGKSVFMKMIQNVMGDMFSDQSANPGLMFKGKDVKPVDHTSRHSALKNARWLNQTECPEGAEFCLMNFKLLVSGEDMVGRGIYQDENSKAKATCKIWFSVNNTQAPTADSNDDAFVRRLIVIDMPNRFNKVGKADQKAASLTSLFGQNGKLQYVVLSWLIEGARRWYKEGLDKSSLPEMVAESTRKFLGHSDPLSQYLNDHVSFKRSQFITAAKLRESYERFCRSNGHTPKGSHKFKDYFLENLQVKFNDVHYKENHAWYLGDGTRKQTHVYMNMCLKEFENEPVPHDAPVETELQTEH